MEAADRHPDRVENVSVIIGYVLVFGLLLTAFVLGGVAVLWYVIFVSIAALVIAMFGRRNLKLHIAVARLLGLLIIVSIFVALLATKLPLVIADDLTPLAQYMQDKAGNAGVVGNVAWLVIMVVAAFIGIGWGGKALFSSKSSVHRILLGALVLAMVTFPVIGIFMQETARAIPR